MHLRNEPVADCGHARVPAPHARVLIPHGLSQLPPYDAAVLQRTPWQQLADPRTGGRPPNGRLRNKWLPLLCRQHRSQLLTPPFRWVTGSCFVWDAQLHVQMAEPRTPSCPHGIRHSSSAVKLFDWLHHTRSPHASGTREHYCVTPPQGKALNRVSSLLIGAAGQGSRAAGGARGIPHPADYRPTACAGCAEHNASRAQQGSAAIHSGACGWQSDRAAKPTLQQPLGRGARRPAAVAAG